MYPKADIHLFRQTSIKIFFKREQLRSRTSKIVYFGIQCGIVNYHFKTWASRSDAMFVFLIISRDEVENTVMAPLREFHWLAVA